MYFDCWFGRSVRRRGNRVHSTPSDGCRRWNHFPMCSSAVAVAGAGPGGWLLGQDLPKIEPKHKCCCPPGQPPTLLQCAPSHSETRPPLQCTPPSPSGVHSTRIPVGCASRFGPARKRERAATGGRRGGNRCHHQGTRAPSKVLSCHFLRLILEQMTSD